MQRNTILILCIAIATILAVTVFGCAPATQPPVQGSPTAQSPAGPPVQGGAAPAVAAREVAVTIEVSKPGNGTHFTTGQAPVVTVSLKDSQGLALTKDDLATLNLYVYGPQEPPKTKTASKLLNAETDRAKTPHHYIDLLKNSDAKVSGNVITYNLKPVTNEEAGTYIATVWAVSKASGLYQAFPWAEFQIGTATVEMQLTDGSKCQVCHRGADSGKFYMHHIDPGRSPTGNWAIDSDPVRTCKACHNTDGYAAYSGNINDPSKEGERTPDPIVRRVHGVHMGEGLKSTFNIDPDKGDFADYIKLVFPANVRNCNFCHLDDRNKTLPSSMACGACHDNTWFGAVAAMPTGRVVHKGGPQTNDAACSGCHTSDTSVSPISVKHKVAPPAFTQKVELTMSAPGNGKFYVAGEKPKVTIIVKDAKTGAAIDPKTIVEPVDPQKVQPGEFRRANLYVSGPRDGTKPVLTAKAADIGPTAGTYANNDFRVLKDATKMDSRFARTATSVVYQLDDVKDLKSGTYTAFVETLPPAPNIGGWAVLNFQVGIETPEKKVATNCIQCHGNTTMHTGYFAVEFNPDICKNCHDYKRQITGKSGWTSPADAPSVSNNGFGAAPLSRRVHGVHFGRYLDKPGQVHATTDYSEVIFPQDVRNCTKCHDAKESPKWKEAPSRVACLGCHDKDAALTHAAVNITDATPAEPYSGDEIETCNVCHGKGKAFSPDKVHNISNPYKPPYPREP